MGSLAVQRVMDQTGQQTLYPFFGKGSNPSSKLSNSPRSSLRPSKNEETAPLSQIQSCTPLCINVQEVGIPILGNEQSRRRGPTSLTSSRKSYQKPPPATDISSEKQIISSVAVGPNSTRAKQQKVVAPKPSEPVLSDSHSLHNTFSNTAESTLLLQQLKDAANSDCEAYIRKPSSIATDDASSSSASSSLQENRPGYIQPQQRCLGSYEEPPTSQKTQEQPQCQLASTSSMTPSAGTVSVSRDHFSELLDSEKEIPRRKILRLNPNGKLLCSPVKDKHYDKRRKGFTKKKKSSGSKRERTDKQPGLAIMKYGVDPGSRQLFGNTVDGIIHGRERYCSIRQPNVRSLSQKAPGPTHPFFSGKPIHKLDRRADPIQDEDTAPLTVSPPKESTQISKAIFRPSLSSVSNATLVKSKDNPAVSSCSGRHPFVKFPVPIDPIWPPHGLLHIRDAESCKSNSSSYRYERFKCDKKKAKGSVLTISDSENILSIPPLQLLASGPNKAEQPCVKREDDTLRHPQKHLTSGNALQELVVEQLAHTNASTLIDPSKTGCMANASPHHKPLHPAVSHLLSSMPASIPAFNRGDFDELLWIHKYAPATAEHVLQVGPEALILSDWLRNLMVSTVSTGNQDKDIPKVKHGKDGVPRRKKRRKKAELEDFIVTSSDESSQMDELSDPDDDELAGDVTIPIKRTVVRSGNPTTGAKYTAEKRPVANSILISGPSGCGKTASVYAVAKELGFEVFEINSGTRRSARDVVERVGDMTQNHLVHLLKHIEGSGAGGSHESGLSYAKVGMKKRRLVNTFFQKSEPAGRRRKAKITATEAFPKSQPSQKQSLILLEEVDILFEDDKQFWNGILALIGQSRRPIIMTCNDENLLPLEELEFHAILRFRQPSCDLAADYILLLSASEGHVLDRKEILNLYIVLQRDLRATITQLNFWCQMAIGSQKSGLDWMAPRQPLPSEPVARAAVPRVQSFDTYVQGMDWLSRDIALGAKDPFEREVLLMLECLDQWHIGVADWQETKLSTSQTLNPNGAWDDIEALKQESQAADLRSVLDVICQTGSSNLTEDVLDASLPTMSGKQRANYPEGYHFLQTDLRTNHTRLSTEIGSTLSVLVDNSSRNASPLKGERAIVDQILKTSSARESTSLFPCEFRNIFEPIMVGGDPFTSFGRQAFSFENGVTAISEDLAPYIRAIVSFDLRLEQRRFALSGILSQDARDGKRIRTTRASRAALEGGNKESTRRERWFSARLNPSRVLATGGHGWQDILLQYEKGKDHSENMSGAWRERSQSCDFESSSDGGI